ncbi:thioredoxin [Mizugakiibacter sediminis]|uniref:Thioredoxin n=1 Tax=Mizugakiibacter sediminis TaxID=1475481 RepID=A0A0K8QN06_9GAMM|nr:thioredoxin [Mizugakiibacter sediminis]GAP66243.1 thioredoxin [Mizugakiibacter sediminis]
MNAAPAASPFVFDVTQATFEAEVLQASLQQPVLVDFWATWCGPCKTLGPLLEKLVAEYDGAVRLAKVDCDKEQMLAGMFGIRSIPTVMLVRDGQIVDGFQGALPESALREFLSRHVQPGAAPAEEALAEEAEDYLAETPEETIARLQQAIAGQPDKPELKLDLALAFMRAGNAAAAEAELDALPANLATDDRARRLRGQLDFARALEGAPPMAELEHRLARNPDDHAARDLLGVRLLVEGETAAGLEQFLDILRAQRDWNDGQAKKRLIAAFNVLDDAELVGTYRRKMASLLF